MTEVISIKFRSCGKQYFFDPGELAVSGGDKVVVETAKGLELADCVRGNHPVEDTAVVQPLRPVIRIATEQDVRTALQLEAREKEAFEICKKKIAEHGLDMKLVSAECGFEGTKTMFFFTSDGRVDFRELVKDLAGIFHNRIELRQIGVRDEAKMIGGIAICGRPYCCGQFLDDFVPVSTKMAKVQSLSLNPAKISGSCGRLMCCLRYEEEAYEDLVRSVPKQGAFVQTADGYGTVAQISLLRQMVDVRLDGAGDGELKRYPADEIAVVPGGRPEEGEPYPDVLKDLPVKKKEPAVVEEKDSWKAPGMFASAAADETDCELYGTAPEGMRGDSPDRMESDGRARHGEAPGGRRRKTPQNERERKHGWKEETATVQEAEALTGQKPENRQRPEKRRKNDGGGAAEEYPGAEEQGQPEGGRKPEERRKPEKGRKSGEQERKNRQELRNSEGRSRKFRGGQNEETENEEEAGFEKFGRKSGRRQGKKFSDRPDKFDRFDKPDKPNKSDKPDKFAAGPALQADAESSQNRPEYPAAGTESGQKNRRPKVREFGAGTGETQPEEAAAGQELSENAAAFAADREPRQKNRKTKVREFGAGAGEAQPEASGAGAAQTKNAGGSAARQEPHQKNRRPKVREFGSGNAAPEQGTPQSGEPRDAEPRNDGAAAGEQRKKPYYGNRHRYYGYYNKNADKPGPAGQT